MAMVQAGLAARVDAAEAVGIEEYKASVKRQVKELAEPMLKMLGAERVAAILAVVPTCRKTKSYKACLKNETTADCYVAVQCPYHNQQEEKWLAPNRKFLDSRYSLFNEGFAGKLEGWRRRFAIGTINKLIDVHNEATQLVLPSIPDSKQMYAECGGILTKPTKWLVLCLYKHNIPIFEAAADAVKAESAKIKKLAEDDLMSRIDGFQDTKDGK